MTDSARNQGQPPSVSGEASSAGAASRAALVGVVLAGGQSRRMGRDKALLAASGDSPLTLLQHAARRLRRFCPEVWVSCAAGRVYADFDCVEDEPSDDAAGEDERHAAGPLRGLAACLARAGREGRQGVLVLPCDMPLLPEQLLHGLLIGAARRTTALAVHYRTAEGWEEPLVAVYRCGALPLLRAALRSGNFRVREALPPDRKLLLPLSEADHALFANCNTPEQARALGIAVPR